jgi:ABC-type transporter Mla MlaB component
MTSPFTIDVSRAGRTARLVLAGEFDQAGSVRLQATFKDAQTLHGVSDVVVDVSALEFCDSAGWHSLERCRDEGATMLGNPACLRRLFYLIEHAHKLPADLHELRGLEPGASERIPLWTR